MSEQILLKQFALEQIVAYIGKAIGGWSLLSIRCSGNSVRSLSLRAEDIIALLYHYVTEVYSTKLRLLKIRI